MCYNSFFSCVTLYILEECDKFVTDQVCSMQKNNNVCKENVFFFIFRGFVWQNKKDGSCTAFNMADLPELEIEYFQRFLNRMIKQ